MHRCRVGLNHPQNVNIAVVAFDLVADPDGITVIPGPTGDVDVVGSLNRSIEQHPIAGAILTRGGTVYTVTGSHHFDRAGLDGGLVGDVVDHDGTAHGVNCSRRTGILRIQPGAALDLNRARYRQTSTGKAQIIEISRSPLGIQIHIQDTIAGCIRNAACAGDRDAVVRHQAQGCSSTTDNRSGNRCADLDIPIPGIAGGVGDGAGCRACGRVDGDVGALVERSHNVRGFDLGITRDRVGGIASDVDVVRIQQPLRSLDPGPIGHQLMAGSLQKTPPALQPRPRDICAQRQPPRLQITSNHNIAAFAGHIAAVGRDAAVHPNLPAVGQQMHGAALACRAVDAARLQYARQRLIHRSCLHVHLPTFSDDHAVFAVGHARADLRGGQLELDAT